jgi:hypothetical protein
VARLGQGSGEMYDFASGEKIGKPRKDAAARGMV